MRLFSYLAIAHGADAVLFFQWRQVIIIFINLFVLLQILFFFLSFNPLTAFYSSVSSFSLLLTFSLCPPLPFYFIYFFDLTSPKLLNLSKSKAGAEKFHSAMVAHIDPKKSRVYQEVKTLGQELLHLSKTTKVL